MSDEKEAAEDAAAASPTQSRNAWFDEHVRNAIASCLWGEPEHRGGWKGRAFERLERVLPDLVERAKFDIVSADFRDAANDAATLRTRVAELEADVESRDRHITERDQWIASQPVPCAAFKPTDDQIRAIAALYTGGGSLEDARAEIATWRVPSPAPKALSDDEMTEVASAASAAVDRGASPHEIAVAVLARAATFATVPVAQVRGDDDVWRDIGFKAMHDAEQAQRDAYILGKWPAPAAPVEASEARPPFGWMAPGTVFFGPQPFALHQAVKVTREASDEALTRLDRIALAIFHDIQRTRSDDGTVEWRERDAQTAYADAVALLAARSAKGGSGQ
jgi:hypothetical protein